MKTIKFFSVALLCGVLAVSCQNSGSKASNPDFSPSELDTLSRAVGYSLGSMVKQAGFGDLNQAEVIKAFMEVLSRTDEITQDEMMSWNQDMQNMMQKKSERLGQRNLTEGQAFLDENRTKEGVVELPSGLQYKVVLPGNDLRATTSDTVEVNYVGTLLDGTEFDSSYKRNEPAKFPLDRVIPAWTEGMQLVGEGGKIILYVPASLGYGVNGAGDQIGPNATLIFEVEVNKIFPAAEGAEAID